MSWHKAGGNPKFMWVLDWRISAFFLLLIGHMRMWTFIALCVAAGVVTVLGYFGYTPSVFYKRVRAGLAGRVRASRPWWWRNRFQRQHLR